jgi:ABC-type transport system involved in multi-copper enzyme maturation permease subunit
MIRVLVLATWRERLSRRLLWGLLAVWGVAVVAIGARVDGSGLQNQAMLPTLILGAGMVGRDLSTGVLPLLLTRPLPRSAYVLARWLAVSSLAGVYSCLLVSAQAVVLWSRGGGLLAVDLLAALLDNVTGAAGLASVLLLFSTFLRGFGDAVLWSVFAIAAGVASSFGGAQRAAEVLMDTLSPQIDWAETLRGTTVSWFALSSYASTVVTALALAIVVMNRKEVSYASS